MTHSSIKSGLVVLVVLLAGCSTTSQYDSSPYISRTPGQPPVAKAEVPLSASAKRELAYHAGVAQSLYQQRLLLLLGRSIL